MLVVFSYNLVNYKLKRKRRIDEVENTEKQLIEQHQNLVKQEQDLFKGLNEKYGDGNYDPNSVNLHFLKNKKLHPKILKNNLWKKLLILI